MNHHPESTQLFVRMGVTALLITLGSAAQLTAQPAPPVDWLDFAEVTGRLKVGADILSDADCGGNGPEFKDTDMACEKDMVVGNLNGDLWESGPIMDIVVVRKGPFYASTGATNILLLNVDGVLVDRTDLIDGFEDVTADRDVVIAELDFDGSLLGGPDIITASTFRQIPRVYINKGCCSDDCATCNNPVVCSAAVNWCGMEYQVNGMVDGQSEPRIPRSTFPYDPFFCAVGVGDVAGADTNGVLGPPDGCPDLYFGDYREDSMNSDWHRLYDVLLINQQESSGRCTGVFINATDTLLHESFSHSDFTTGVEIVDVNGDGCQDLLKVGVNELKAVYQNKDVTGCLGTFPVAAQTFRAGGKTYMGGTGDFNNDGNLDIYEVRDNDDTFRLGDGFGTFVPAPHLVGTLVVGVAAKTLQFGGNVTVHDMNPGEEGGPYKDVIVSDGDVEQAVCFRKLGIHKSEVDSQDNMIVSLNDPLVYVCTGGTKDGDPCEKLTRHIDCPPYGLCEARRVWNTFGTHDTALLTLNEADPPAMLVGTCGGLRLFVVGTNPVIYVDKSATGAGDGKSWADAFTDLDDGLAEAEANTNAAEVPEVWVAAGTYHTGNTPFDIPDVVEMYGGFVGTENRRGQRDPMLNETILNGSATEVLNLTPENADQAHPIIDGFIIQNGDNKFPGGFCTCNGGGMVIEGGSPWIRRCVFRDNLGFIGGAILSDGASPLISNSLFYDNYSESDGGAIAQINGGKLTVMNCTIVENDANTDGGGIYTDVGVGQSAAKIKNSIVWNNTDGGTDIELAQIFDGGSVDAVVSYTIVEDGAPPVYAGTANLDDDPLFADAANDDFTLGANSPACDTGGSKFVPAPAGAYDTLALNGKLRSNVLFSITPADRGAYEINDTNLNVITDQVDLDECGVGETWCDDCNGNGILDVSDISYGISEDCGSNGIPDECETPNTAVCCLGTNNCIITWQSCCTEQGGTFKQFLSTCGPMACPGGS